MSDALWSALRVPASRGAELGMVGLMPPALRKKLGLTWTRAQQLELRALGAASRRVGPVLPDSFHNFGPLYLRWRADAIGRGEVASGRGSKFGPAAATPVAAAA
jgi:uncharacterized protein (DUF2236 family)